MTGMVGCGSDSKSTLEGQPPIQMEPGENDPGFKVPEFQSLSFEETPLSQKTRAFLIAGSRDTANFAQEVLEQKEYLLSKGLTSDEIACYYSVPLTAEYLQDRMQYDALRETLASCYLASPSFIWSHLKTSALGNPDTMYIYVTSHGSRPLTAEAMDPRTSPEDRGAILTWVSRFPDLDQFMVALDTAVFGRTISFNFRLEQLSNGTSAKKLFFTPRYLKEALLQYPPLTRKYIAVQACYSGGFLKGETSEQEKDSLKDVPNVSVMTAARPDRTSFGCDPGGKRTVFGETFFTHLKGTGELPWNADWSTLHADVSSSVKKREREMRVKPSEPQFFTNVSAPAPPPPPEDEE